MQLLNNLTALWYFPSAILQQEVLKQNPGNKPCYNTLLQLPPPPLSLVFCFLLICIFLIMPLYTLSLLFYKPS